MSFEVKAAGGRVVGGPVFFAERILRWAIELRRRAERIAANDGRQTGRDLTRGEMP